MITIYNILLFRLHIIMSKFIGTDIQQKVIAILESKKTGDLVKYKRLARDLKDMSLAVRSVENSIGVGVGKLESFYPKCVYELCSKTVIVSAHSLAHEDELLKKNLRFLLVDSTVMAFRYYTDELSKNFSGFVKPTGNELTNIVRPSIINDGEFYPDGLYKSSLLESTVPSLKLIESKFKTNPVILYNNANDMANWNKAKGIILDRFPEAVNVVWIRMIVDNTSEENSVKEPLKKKEVLARHKVSKAKRQKELRASQKFKDDSNQKRRDVRAGLTKEAKKEASRKRKLQPSQLSKKKRKVADALKALGFTSSSSATVRFCCSAPVDNRQ